MASAMGAGTPRRARRVGVSIGVPVRVWWSAATLRAWSIRAAGTGTGEGPTYGTNAHTVVSEYAPVCVGATYKRIVFRLSRCFC